MKSFVDVPVSHGWADGSNPPPGSHLLLHKCSQEHVLMYGLMLAGMDRTKLSFLFDKCLPSSCSEASHAHRAPPSTQHTSVCPLAHH